MVKKVWRYILQIVQIIQAIFVWSDSNQNFKYHTQLRSYIWINSLYTKFTNLTTDSNIKASFSVMYDAVRSLCCWRCINENSPLHTAAWRAAVSGNVLDVRRSHNLADWIDTRNNVIVITIALLMVTVVPYACTVYD